MNKKEQFIPLNNLINAISMNSASQGGSIQTSIKPQDKLQIQKIFLQRGLHKKKRSDEFITKDNRDAGTEKQTNFSQGGRRLTDTYGRQLPSHAYSFSMKGISSHRKEDSLAQFDWGGQHMSSQYQNSNSSKQQIGNDDSQQYLVQDNNNNISGKKSSYSYLDSQTQNKISARSNHAMTSCFELNVSQYKVRQASLNSGEIIRARSVLNDNTKREYFHRQTEMVREKGQKLLRNSSLVKHSEKILKILPASQKNTLEGQLIRMEDSFIINNSNNNNDLSFQTNKLSDRNHKSPHHFLSTDSCDQSNNNMQNQFSNDSPLKQMESQEDKGLSSTKDVFSKDAMDFMLIEMMSKIDETIMKKILQGEEQFGVKHWKRISEILNENVPLILRKVEDLVGMKSTICSFLIFLGNFFSWFLNLSINHIEKRVAAAEFKVKLLFEDKLKSLENLNQELLESFKKQESMNQQLIDEHSKSEDQLRKQIKKLQTQIFLLEEELNEAKQSENIHESCEQMTEKISDLQHFIDRLQQENTLSGYTMEDGFNCLAGSLVPRNKPMVDFIDSIKGFWNNSEALNLSDSDMKKGMEEFFNNQQQTEEIQDKTIAEIYLEFVMEKYPQNDRKVFREIEETVKFLGRSKSTNCVCSFFCQLLGIKGFSLPGNSSVMRIIALNSGKDLKGIALEDRIDTQAAITSLKNCLPVINNEIIGQFEVKFERVKSIQKIQILSFILSAVEQESENENLIKVGLKSDESSANNPLTIPRTRNVVEDSQFNLNILGCSQEEQNLRIFNQTKTSMEQLIGECMIKVLNFQKLLSNQFTLKLNTISKTMNSSYEGKKLDEQLTNNNQDQNSDNSIKKQRFSKGLKKLKTQLKLFGNSSKKQDN